VVLHLTQSFNKILAFMVKDEDGAQTREIIFLLEKARRSLSVLKLYLDKTQDKEIKQGAQIVLEAIRSIMDTLSGKPG
jgi:hypothetical protein